jgi:hypothetical protein
MQNVFDDYENGRLKDQKSRSMTPVNVQKALEGKFSANLMHFQPFQGVKVSRQSY